MTEEQATYEYSGWDQPDQRCIHCQVRSIDKAQNPDSQLCGECRKELIKLRVPVGVWLMMAAILILTAAACLWLPSNVKGYSDYVQTDDLVADGYIGTALMQLSDQLIEHPESKKVAIKLCDIAMEYEYYDYAAWAIDEYLTKRDLSDGEYNKLTGYVDRLNLYYDTYDMLDTILSSEVQEGVSDEDMQEYYYQAVLEYWGNTSYDQAYLAYALAQISTDYDTYIEWTQTCTSLSKNYTAAWSDLANYYRRSGDLAKARELLETSYNYNKEDASVLRSYAILELLEGKQEQALEYAEAAYNWYPDGVYVADTYLVVMTQAGQQEAALRLKEELEAEGYYFDETLVSFMNGEITLEDYYMGE